jgi:hypothetical protein
MNLRHIWGDATCGRFSIWHNAQLWCSCIPALQYMFRKPVEMTMNYMDYTDDRGMFMFSNGQNQEWELFFFQVEREHHSEYNFLLLYIRKTRYLLASFLCYMRSIKSKCIINYIFCIRQMRLQITFRRTIATLVICHNTNSSLFGNKPIQIQVSVYYNQFYFLPLNWTILSIKYNSGP